MRPCQHLMDNFHLSVPFFSLIKIGYDDLWINFFLAQNNFSLYGFGQYFAGLFVPGMLPRTGYVRMPVQLNSEICNCVIGVAPTRCSFITHIQILLLHLNAVRYHYGNAKACCLQLRRVIFCSIMGCSDQQIGIFSIFINEEGVWKPVGFCRWCLLLPCSVHVSTRSRLQQVKRLSVKFCLIHMQ